MSEVNKEEGFSINTDQALQTVKQYAKRTQASAERTWEANTGWLAIMGLVLVAGWFYFYGSTVTDSAQLAMYQEQAEKMLNHPVTKAQFHAWQNEARPQLEEIKRRNPDLASRRQFRSAYDVATMWHATYYANTIFRN